MARWHRVLSFVERELWDLRRSRQKTIAALTVGLLRKQEVGQASIACGMVDGTSVKHRVKRIGRFLVNEAIEPWEVSRHLVEAMMPKERESLVVVDWTDRGDYMLLKASLPFRHRALPLAWHHVRKWDFEKSQNDVEEQFILRLASLIGRERRWVLVADRGFGRAELIRVLLDERIQFVIRDADDVWVTHGAFEGRLRDLPRERGHCVLYEGVAYHKTQRLAVNLAVCHKEPAPEPWFLITNLQRPAQRIERIYAKRMGIEEGIRDCKSGLRLKRLWLSEAVRMDRMMILVALAILLIALTAVASIARGEDLQVSTSKRKAPPVSWFTLGCRIIELYPDLLCTDRGVLYAA
jgi:hypothetical protein